MDTPGFDDADRSDVEILHQIQAWLESTFEKKDKQLLSAILYFHPITSTRFQGSNGRLLRRFKKLLGQECYRNVLLISTFWNQAPEEICLAREKELMEMPEAWKPLVDGGAQVERMDRDFLRFVPILSKLAQLSPMKLEVPQKISEDDDGGAAIEHASSALSLFYLRAEHDAKLSGVKEDWLQKVEGQKSRAAAANETLKTKRREIYEKELAQQHRENQAVDAYLKEVGKRQAEESQARRICLEESRQKEQEWRKKWKKEAKSMRRGEGKARLETAGDLLLRASTIQKEIVEEGMDLIRAVYHSDLKIAGLRGVSLKGIGIFVEGSSGGRDLREYSVTRTGLNKWCDACRFPIGAKVRYRELSLPS